MAKTDAVESMTKLLKENDAPISAVKANKLLLEKGLLLEMERKSSTREGVMKKYKVLTDSGLNYGINRENPQSPDQTSPYYYRESFEELLKILLETVD